MLNTLQRDILKRHIGPFFFSLVTILFLLLLQFLILHIDKLVGKGLELSILIELIAYQLAYMLVLAAPMSVLVAALMAYGKFSELNELTAVKAAGVTPLQLMKPVLFAAILLGIFLAWFSNEVLPESNFKARSLFLDVRMKKPGFDLRTNTFYDGIEGYTFLVRDMSAQADTMFDVTIYQDATPTREQAIIRAKKGILTGEGHNFTLILDLFDGSVYRPLPDSRGTTTRHEESLFDQHRIRFDLSDMAFSRTNPDMRRRDDRTMTSQAMRVVVDSMRIEIEKEFERLASINEPVNKLSEGPRSLDRRYRTSVYTVFEESNQLNRAYSDAKNTLMSPDTTAPYFVLKYLKDAQSQATIVNDASIAIRSHQGQLFSTQSNLQWRNERIAQFRVEIIKKIAIPFGCVVFILIGAPLGMITRKGNLGLSVVISSVLFTYYWITVIQGEKLADRLVITPFWGMWFGNITLGVLGLIILVKLTTEFRIRDILSRDNRN
jgi:lipopolysaccharide export system permease protein